MYYSFLPLWVLLATFLMFVCYSSPSFLLFWLAIQAHRAHRFTDSFYNNAVSFSDIGSFLHGHVCISIYTHIVRFLLQSEDVLPGSSSRHVQVPINLVRLHLSRPESITVLIQDSSIFFFWLNRRYFITLVLEHHDRHYHEFLTGFRRCFTRVSGGIPPFTAEYRAKLTSSGWDDATFRISTFFVLCTSDSSTHSSGSLMENKRIIILYDS